ncbi:MAG: phosphoribosylaminoimidazolesuccinocarboxamide synthase [Natronomonas sp.]
MTSVKRFRIETPATDTALGRGAFVFTDDYSVFDWGPMPDSIPRKGASLCSMGAANFEALEDAGIPTHYRGVVAGGTTASLGAVGEPPREMAIDLTQVPDLPHEGREYDYESYHREAGDNYLVPLEVVFRNAVPIGSSLRDRVDPTEVGLDTDTWPDEPVELPDPIVEFSTKYEESDRHLSRAEADRIAGAADIDALESIAHDVNELVTERAAEAGLTHEDGKIECLYYDGEIRVADVVGTFDENRFSHDGQQLSKEVIRQYHKRTQPEWIEAVEAAKRRAKNEGVADWRTLCERDPEPIPDRVIDAASDMYAAGTNAYLDRRLFDVPPLSDAIATIRDL